MPKNKPTAAPSPPDDLAEPNESNDLGRARAQLASDLETALGEKVCRPLDKLAEAVDDADLANLGENLNEIAKSIDAGFVTLTAAVQEVAYAIRESARK